VHSPTGSGSGSGGGAGSGIDADSAGLGAGEGHLRFLNINRRITAIAAGPLGARAGLAGCVLLNSPCIYFNVALDWLSRIPENSMCRRCVKEREKKKKKKVGARD
jgi:hypothetical protein